MEKLEEELPDFQFPLVVPSRTIEDYNLDKKLPLELFLRHEGFKIRVDDKNYFLQIIGIKDSLNLIIYPSGGVHSHGAIQLPYVIFQKEGQHLDSENSGLPKILWKVQLYRPLTAEEIEKDPDRWATYRAGERVRAFDNTLLVCERARYIAKRHFPGFKMLIE